MIIVAGGDSFVYGSELKDCQDKTMKNLYGHSISTFTALLAQETGYHCVAWPGFGNDSIARTIITKCEQVSVGGVLVSWTFPGRYEFRFAYDTLQKTGNWNTITPWTTQTADKIEKEFDSNNYLVLVQHTKAVDRAKETGVAEFADIFYRHVGSTEYWEVYSSLKEIVYLQNYLTIKNIPYMFTCADTVLIDNFTIDHADDTIKSLFEQIDFSKWFLFPEGTHSGETMRPRGFYQWAVENKYRMGTTHPLEEAHADAAKLMKDKFNELVKKSV